MGEGEFGGDRAFVVFGEPEHEQDPDDADAKDEVEGGFDRVHGVEDANEEQSAESDDPSEVVDAAEGADFAFWFVFDEAQRVDEDEDEDDGAGDARNDLEDSDGEEVRGLSDEEEADDEDNAAQHHEFAFAMAVGEPSEGGLHDEGGDIADGQERRVRREG